MLYINALKRFLLQLTRKVINLWRNPLENILDAYASDLEAYISGQFAVLL